jgi:hypothetical protein
MAKRSVDGGDLFKLWVLTAVVIGGAIYAAGIGTANCNAAGLSISACFTGSLAHVLQPYLAFGAIALIALSVVCTILYRVRRR